MQPVAVAFGAVVVLLLAIFLRAAMRPSQRNCRVSWRTPLYTSCEFDSTAPASDITLRWPWSRSDTAASSLTKSADEGFYVRGTQPASERELSRNISGIRWKVDNFVSGRADFDQYESGYNTTDGDERVFARRSAELNPVEIMTPPRATGASPTPNGAPAPTGAMQLLATSRGAPHVGVRRDPPALAGDRIFDYHHGNAGSAFVTL